MVSWKWWRRASPIGVDLGSRSVKLVQLNHDRTQILETARWDLTEPLADESTRRAAQWIEALRRAREGRKFIGREAVLCLGQRELFVQNLRVPKPAGGDLTPAVRQQVADRLPYPILEADIRFVDAAEVRQADASRREVVVLACHRPTVHAALAIAEAAGLRPVAIDAEPLALLRAYAAQYRRDADQAQRAMYIHVGYCGTAVVIAQGTDALFVKYLDLGGRHFDEAVSRHLRMSLAEAWALRRHNGDRRADQQDAEVARSVGESLRGPLDRLVSEISLCVRYHSVTFRGQPLARCVLGGGEASTQVLERLASRMELKCELGDPLRAFPPVTVSGRRPQWDVALGLALREVTP